MKNVFRNSGHLLARRGKDGQMANDGAKIRKLLNEVVTIVADKKLAKAVQIVAKDKTLLGKVKANPGRFLRDQGLTVPAGTKIKVGTKKVTLLSPRARVLRFGFELCIYHTYTIGKGTFLEHEITLKVCRTYLIY